MTEHQLPSPLEVSPEAPDRNLALELVRVTEAAAMAAGRWVGRGDKIGADGAAVNAMRTLVSTVSMNGVVVIGEGEKDEAPMLFNGERVGDGTGAEVDIAVDPIDGTTLNAKGMPNAIAVLAAADRGTMFDPSAVFYMDKLVTGPEAADFVDINAPVSVNIRRVAKAKKSSPEDVTVVILDRPRHDDIVKEIRETGARIKFISDGDVAGSIMAVREGTGVDLLMGIGGTPRASSRRARSSAWAARSRASSGRRTPPSGSGRSTPGTIWTGCCRRTTWSAATTCSSSRRASRTASCCAGCATARRPRPPSPW